jgi:anti-sigma regulatory factor (Ser/Thr protein kinase)
MTLAKPAAQLNGTLMHEALLYKDSDAFLAGTLPFIRDGLVDDEPILVAVPAANISLLRDELGDEAAEVHFIDMTEIGRNPGRIIPAVLHAFISAHPRERVRIIGEPIWPGRTAQEYPACVQHEALINMTFADRSAAILCPYDAARLEPVMLRDAFRTHPVMLSSGRRRASGRYGRPQAVVASFNRPLPEPAGPTATMTFNGDALSRMRRVVANHAQAAGLAEARIGDLQVAVNEVATNSIAHAGAPGTLRIWQEQNTLVCEIRDRGRLTDPLVGRVPPAPESEHGRGLLLVNYLCDLVRVYTHRAGVTIRLHMAL